MGLRLRKVQNSLTRRQGHLGKNMVSVCTTLVGGKLCKFNLRSQRLWLCSYRRWLEGLLGRLCVLKDILKSGSNPVHYLSFLFSPPPPEIPEHCPFCLSCWLSASIVLLPPGQLLVTPHQISKQTAGSDLVSCTCIYTSQITSSHTSRSRNTLSIVPAPGVPSAPKKGTQPKKMAPSK